MKYNIDIKEGDLFTVADVLDIEDVLDANSFYRKVRIIKIRPGMVYRVTKVNQHSLFRQGVDVISPHNDSKIFIPWLKLNKIIITKTEMGLIQNKAMLEKLQDYLGHTNFGNQSIGHNLTLSFLPKKLQKPLEDKRYSFNLKHRLFTNAKQFQKVTYSEIVVGVILSLTDDIVNLPKETIDIYSQVGLIEDNKCTKELISTVMANAIALNPVHHSGNTTTNLKFSDNLQNIFPEFGPKNIEFFLNNLDKYKPTI